MNQQNQKLNHDCRADILLCALLAAVTFGVVGFYSLYGADPHHDGVMFEAALKVARGGVLFRDTFTQYGALAVWYDALFIRLFGESMASIQLAAAAALAGCAVLLYTITQKLTCRPLAFCTGLTAVGLNYVFFWHSHPWSSLPAMFFQLLACELLMEACEREKGQGWRLALAGACSALGAFCRLPVGLLTFLAGLGALILLQVWRRKKAAQFFAKAAVYIAGFGVALLLEFLPILLTHCFDAWWGMEVVGTSGFAAETNTAGASTGFLMRLLWDLVGAWILRNPLFDWIWFVLPACMGFTLLFTGWPVLAAYFKNLRSPAVPPCSVEAQQIVIVCTLAFGGWAQYYPVACYRHWFWSALPMVPILAFDIWLFARRRRTSARVSCLLLALVLLPNLAVRGWFALASVGAVSYTQNPEETRPGITEFYLDEHWNRGKTEGYESVLYPYLNGLHLAPEVTEFYDTLFTTLDGLKARYPEKNILNKTSDGFMGVFQGEYIPYGDAPYSEYGAVEEQYVRQKRPIVIAQSEKDWQGWDAEYKTYAVITGNDGRMTNSTLYIMVAE